MASVLAAAAGSAFKTLGKIKPSTWKSMKEAYKEAEAVEWGSIVELLTNLGALDPILKPLNVAMQIFSGVLQQNLMPAMQAFFDLLADPAVQEVIRQIADLLSIVLVGAFWVLYNALILFINLWHAGITTIQVLWGGMIAAWEGFWAMFFGTFEIGLAFIEGLWNIFLTGLENVGLWIKSIWEGIIMPVWNGIMVLFDIFGAAIGFIYWHMLKPAFEGIIAVFQWFVNGLIDVINFFTRALNWIPGINIPTIPHVETGGDILKTGLAVVHKKERVLNAKDAEADRRGGRGGKSKISRWAGYDMLQESRRQTLLAAQNLKYTKRMLRLMEE